MEWTTACGADWDGYVEAHPEGTLFHTTPWKQAVERTFGHEAHYLYAERGGAPTGVLPLFLVPTLKGKAFVSVPYGVYGGILADSHETQAALLDAARDLAQQQRCKYIELRSKRPNPLNLATTQLYVNFEKPLPTRATDCLAAIPRKSRASVRNGRNKFELRSVFTRDLETLHEQYALNVRRLGSPVIPFRFLVELRDAFGERMDVLHTLFEGRVVSCVLNFYFKDTVVPYYSGSDSSYFFTQCNNVMYCDLMEVSVERGYKHFDFGRSRQGTGAHDFKVNMGFAPTPLHYQYVLLGLRDVPKINPSNPKLELPRRLWSHLPLGVTKWVGPQLLKYIP